MQQDLFSNASASPEPAPIPESRLRLGTSGYSYTDWVGPFYPPGTSGANMLPVYARTFSAVELNTSYYNIPKPDSLARMAERTPRGFHFTVKLHQDMTHRNSTDPGLFRKFLAAVEPLRRQGKLKGLLAQFPWGFRYCDASLRHIEFLKAALPEDELTVEFRRDEWDRTDVLDFLRERGIGYCCVDEPPLPGLLPARAALTTDVGYVRFHGRNAGSWWGGDGSDRYNYDYSQPELEGWLGRIAELVKDARQVYVFFNNCHAGHAASNALLMQQLLKREGLPF